MNMDLVRQSIQCGLDVLNFFILCRAYIHHTFPAPHQLAEFAPIPIKNVATTPGPLSALSKPLLDNNKK